MNIWYFQNKLFAFEMLVKPLIYIIESQKWDKWIMFHGLQMNSVLVKLQVAVPKLF